MEDFPKDEKILLAGKFEKLFEIKYIGEDVFYIIEERPIGVLSRQLDRRETYINSQRPDLIKEFIN